MTKIPLPLHYPSLSLHPLTSLSPSLPSLFLSDPSPNHHLHPSTPTPSSSPIATTPTARFAVKSAPLSDSFLLQREQQIHSSIPTSPFVISYLGFDVTADHFHLFLELAAGGSRSDQIKSSGKIPEPAIRAHTPDILMGLAHLHSLGLVHGDVKSQNVLIDGGGSAKIADLGCARFPANGETVKNMKFMGTQMFAAPEVARGGEQGTVADIWAVGWTVVEMATDRAPWPDASDPVSLMHRIACSGERPVVPEWMSEEGRDFLDRCLRREAADRCGVHELLMHPFVARDSEREWTSPKSTLDRCFWDSMSESEPEDEGRVEIGAGRANPIGVLFDVDRTSPDWTWGDSWVTVRNGSTDPEEDQGVPSAEIDSSSDDQEVVAMMM